MTEPNSSPSLDLILERLASIEEQLARIAGLLESSAPAQSAGPPVQEKPTGQDLAIAKAPPRAESIPPHEPPRIQVAAPKTHTQGAPAKVESGTPISPSGIGAFSEEEEDFAGIPNHASVREVLSRIFEAALMEDEEKCYAILEALTHPSQIQGPRAVAHFKAFNWTKLRRTATGYLRDGDPNRFDIAYTDPETIDKHVDRVRVFIRTGDHRMPAPIAFRKDTSRENAWRIISMSL